MPVAIEAAFYTIIDERMEASTPSCISVGRAAGTAVGSKVAPNCTSEIAMTAHRQWGCAPVLCSRDKPGSSTPHSMVTKEEGSLLMGLVNAGVRGM